MKNSKIATGRSIHGLEKTTVSNRISPLGICYQGQQARTHGIAIALSEETKRKDANETTRTHAIQIIFKGLSVTDKIDFLAFVVFNAAFITFNIWYFLH